MIAWLLDRLATWLLKPGRLDEYLHIGDYMRRWWIIPYNRLGVAVRVHEILRSDADRHLHDHPWPFLTVILRGGYWEEQPVQFRGPNNPPLIRLRWRGPGSVLFRRHTDWHRLDVDEAQVGPTVTLFVSFRYRHEWGFLVDGVKVSHREYNSRKEGLDPRLITENSGKYVGRP